MAVYTLPWIRMHWEIDPSTWRCTEQIQFSWFAYDINVSKQIRKTRQGNLVPLCSKLICEEPNIECQETTTISPLAYNPLTPPFILAQGTSTWWSLDNNNTTTTNNNNNNNNNNNINNNISTVSISTISIITITMLDGIGQWSPSWFKAENAFNDGFILKRHSIQLKFPHYASSSAAGSATPLVTDWKEEAWRPWVCFTS